MIPFAYEVWIPDGDEIRVCLGAVGRVHVEHEIKRPPQKLAAIGVNAFDLPAAEDAQPRQTPDPLPPRPIFCLLSGVRKDR